MTTDPALHADRIRASQALVEAVRAYSRTELAAVGQRLAASLEARFSGHTQPPHPGLPDPSRDALGAALDFASNYARACPPRFAPPPAAHPLVRLEALSRAPHIAALLHDLVLLACLPEAHEGFATLCRLMHPDGEPVPTVALALHWLETETAAVAGSEQAVTDMRDAVEALLCHSPIAQMGLLTLAGDGPWHGRKLLPGDGLWAALMAQRPQLEAAELIGGYEQVPGLDHWLAEATVSQALAALRRSLPCQILISGGDAAMRATRVRALLGAVNAAAIRTPIDGLSPEAFRQRCRSTYTAALMHQACLWLESDASDGENIGERATPPSLEWALPVITSAGAERSAPNLGVPLIRLPIDALPAVARRDMWHTLLPQLGEQASLLAARYPIDPEGAREIVRDLGLRQQLSDVPLDVDEIGQCIRARSSWHARPGIRRVVPRADWSRLLLPGTARRQLQSAVQRVIQQITVLDDWGFAQGRDERRGVRMLFFGPPGTGKTLSAEVMAQALGVDLLVVDLAALVSKWIGETEKNLAAVFEIAERSRALLLFDEADALFAKRTDTQDAHDRYANLETAYLLQRLERYEGVAVLTTNLRANLDKAFSRRFEHIVEFPEPDADARQALWRLHLPASAPLGDDVALAELAAWYPIPGAQIKNASLTAAFLAAAAGSDIRQHHFLLAIEREYDKAGRAHPGFPPNIAWPVDTESDGALAPPTTH